MTTELTLQRTTASGSLLPTRLARSLALLAKLPKASRSPIASMRGQELRVALASDLDDGACSGFLLEFAGQGQRVRGAARGPSAAALVWAFHALASAVKCALLDDGGNEIAPTPEAHREAAADYLSAYEAEVRADRKAPGDDEAGELLAWLAREEHVALGEGAGELAAQLPLEDAPALYEMLLESEAIDDVFVSESELTTLLARFRARRSP